MAQTQDLYPMSFEYREELLSMRQEISNNLRDIKSLNDLKAILQLVKSIKK